MIVAAYCLVSANQLGIGNTRYLHVNCVDTNRSISHRPEAQTSPRGDTASTRIYSNAPSYIKYLPEDYQNNKRKDFVATTKRTWLDFRGQNNH